MVDDEPIARKGVKKLVEEIPALELLGCLNSAKSAAVFMNENPVDLVFPDIQMHGVNGMEFVRSIPKTTLVIFITAFTEYALDIYEVDAVSYLVKPIEPARFRKAVENIGNEYIFVKSDHRYFKVNLKDILFVEGLKNYVIIQLEDKRIITRMSLKNIQDLLPQNAFFRINRSYIINREQIDSFDNNDVFIKSHEIAIGNSYWDSFFERLMGKK
jgi:DNA-binding LytR/AlgR family response regulator